MRAGSNLLVRRSHGRSPQQGSRGGVSVCSEEPPRAPRPAGASRGRGIAVRGTGPAEPSGHGGVHPWGSRLVVAATAPWAAHGWPRRATGPPVRWRSPVTWSWNVECPRPRGPVVGEVDVAVASVAACDFRGELSRGAHRESGEPGGSVTTKVSSGCARRCCARLLQPSRGDREDGHAGALRHGRPVPRTKDS
jgi:hypothetical protein